MPPERSHHEFCDKLCLVCLRKGPGLRTINGSAGSSSKHDYVDYIRQSWWPDFKPDDENLPRVLCLTCRLKLVKNNDPTNSNPPTLPPKLMYENLVFKPQTRMNLKCECEICLHGRFRWKELGRHSAFSVLPVPQTPPKSIKRKRSPSPTVVTRCKRCLQIVGKGIRHTCNRTSKLQNLSGNFQGNLKKNQI